MKLMFNLYFLYPSLVIFQIKKKKKKKKREREKIPQPSIQIIQRILNLTSKRWIVSKGRRRKKELRIQVQILDDVCISLAPPPAARGK